MTTTATASGFDELAHAITATLDGVISQRSSKQRRDADLGEYDSHLFWYVPLEEENALFIALEQSEVDGVQHPPTVTLSVRDGNGDGEPVPGRPDIVLVGVTYTLAATILITVLVSQNLEGE